MLNGLERLKNVRTLDFIESGPAVGIALSGLEALSNMPSLQELRIERAVFAAGEQPHVL